MQVFKYLLFFFIFTTAASWPRSVREIRLPECCSTVFSLPRTPEAVCRGCGIWSECSLCSHKGGMHFLFALGCIFHACQDRCLWRPYVSLIQIDYAVHQIYSKMTEAQKKFAKYAEQIQKINEMHSVLNRVKMNVEQTSALMERLNSVLPPSEQLEPFSMKPQKQSETDLS